jgi:hypothetical protein
MFSPARAVHALFFSKILENCKGLFVLPTLGQGLTDAYLFYRCLALLGLFDVWLFGKLLKIVKDFLFCPRWGKDNNCMFFF